MCDNKKCIFENFGEIGVLNFENFGKIGKKSLRKRNKRYFCSEIT